MGGTQSLHTNSMDEALGLPTESAARVALRTQQIIAHESGVCDTVDPLGGSYVIEYLTDELEKRARTYIDTIDSLGGMMAAIEVGYVNNEIDNAAYAYQQSLEKDEALVVGVNAFREAERVSPPIQKIDPAIEAAQCQRVAALRQRRDNERVSALRQQIAQRARTNENMLPLFVVAVENDLTLGEICQTLREVWGEFRPNF